MQQREPLGRQRLAGLRIRRRAHRRRHGEQLVLRVLRADVHERAGGREEDGGAGHEHGRRPQLQPIRHLGPSPPPFCHPQVREVRQKLTACGQMPGGGFGIFNGCTPQYGTPSTGWGAQYGGVSSRSQCDAFPQKLQAGCYWRFDWFKNADNPGVSWKSVNCPKALTALTGCVRADDSPTGDANVPTYTGGGAAAPTTMTATTSPGGGSGTGGTVAKYGQCGGTGYTGPTQCEAGSTCTVSNQWYSQCL